MDAAGPNAYFVDSLFSHTDGSKPEMDTASLSAVFEPESAFSGFECRVTTAAERIGEADPALEDTVH
jgi:hypothetical protein